jgi:hypothetical protein
MADRFAQSGIHESHEDQPAESARRRIPDATDRLHDSARIGPIGRADSGPVPCASGSVLIERPAWRRRRATSPAVEWLTVRSPVTSVTWARRQSATFRTVSAGPPPVASFGI